MKKLALIILIFILGLALVGTAFAGPPKGTGTTFVVNHEGNYLKIDENGALDAFIQDQTSPPLDLYFTQAINAPSALSNATIINATSVVIDSVANFSAGNYMGIFSGASGEGRFYFGEVISVVGNTITLDSPLDFAYDAGDPVVSTTRELNVNGAGTSQIFQIQVGGVNTPITVDITKIMIQATTSGTPDFADFGDITGGLINGVVLRQVDGVTRNFWNIKTNGEFANIAYDFTPYLAANPGLGVNGFAVRFTFSGQAEHGVAVRLDPADLLQVIIQDDLSDLLTFRIIAQGHVVVD